MMGRRKVQFMMPPDNDKDDLLLSSEIIALSTEPLIGQLRLTTDNGDVVMAVNAESAQALVEELITFLDTQ
jgi:hypothetical protein